MAKKPYHHYAKPRTEQPPRNPSLDTLDGKDLSTAWLLCIFGSSLALYKGVGIFWNRIRSHHAACKAIRNNSLYDGEPLPGLLRQKALPKPEL